MTCLLEIFGDDVIVHSFPCKICEAVGGVVFSLF